MNRRRHFRKVYHSECKWEWRTGDYVLTVYGEKEIGVIHFPRWYIKYLVESFREPHGEHLKECAETSKALGMGVIE